MRHTQQPLLCGLRKEPFNRNIQIVRTAQLLYVTGMATNAKLPAEKLMKATAKQILEQTPEKISCHSPKSWSAYATTACVTAFAFLRSPQNPFMKQALAN
jgi:hypothetical protein